MEQQFSSLKELMRHISEGKNPFWLILNENKRNKEVLNDAVSGFENKNLSLVLYWFKCKYLEYW